MDNVFSMEAGLNSISQQHFKSRLKTIPLSRSGSLTSKTRLLPSAPRNISTPDTSLSVARQEALALSKTVKVNLFVFTLYDRANKRPSSV